MLTSDNNPNDLHMTMNHSLNNLHRIWVDDQGLKLKPADTEAGGRSHTVSRSRKTSLSARLFQKQATAKVTSCAKCTPRLLRPC